MQIPVEFSQGVTRCGKFVRTGHSFHLLASQHSKQIRFSVELQLLSIVRQKGGRLIRQILYGCNDCTIPPIGNHSVSVRSGRALLDLNIELTY